MTNLQEADVLVTGGAGFIGSQIVSDLLDRGANVHVLDNLFAGAEELVPEEAGFSDVDIRESKAKAEIVNRDPDIIIHLAAIHYIPYCNDHPEEAFRVNVMGTRNVLEAARETSELEKFVFGSSAAVYPPRNVPHTEESEVGPMDIYGETKLIGEDLVELFHHESTVPAVSARFFNVYGPNETNPHLIPAILEQLEDGNREIDLGNLTPRRDFINIKDVSRAVLTLVTEFDGGYRTFNVGTGRENSVRDVVNKISEAMGQEITILQDDERVRESDRPHLCAEVSRLSTETSWKPQIDFVDGLRTLIQEEVESE